MKRKIFITAAVALGTMVGLFVQPLISGDNVYQQLKKIERVLGTASKNYVDSVDNEKLTEAAIRGMLNELDPHSIYISADEKKGVDEDFTGSFEGIGVEFDVINDTITVVTAIPDGPSDKLGIQSGDRIVNIDGTTAIGIDRNDVPKRLKGPKGTSVVVDIKRSGMSDLVTYTIKRDKIPKHTVDATYIVDGTDIGVVAINRFAATTHSELVEALHDLKNQGMKKVILDLRGNPGGFLNEAVAMVDEFLGGHDTIVFTHGRVQGGDECYYSNSGDEFEKMPVIILVNMGSASASEIVSGAIQDHDRGLIVGETSYGKGLVQRQFDLDDGSAYRITISRYYTPSGRCIQRPYKDKEKYRHLAGRLELEEGSYLEDAIEKIKAQAKKLNDKEKDPKMKINMDSLPIFHTRKGRAVFGGGGITPDYIVKTDTITKFSVQLRIKNVFYEFVDSYLKGEGKELKAKYANDYHGFLRNWEPSTKVMKEFRKLAEGKEVKWDDADYKVDGDYIQLLIKAYIARSLWDRNKMSQIFSKADRQLEQAVKLFPVAEKMVR
jgi:carboxyl-terminal processing protease